MAVKPDVPRLENARDKRGAYTLQFVPPSATLPDMGILLFMLALFILMGGIQMLGVAAIGGAVIGVFVLSSMMIGKTLFRL